MTGVISQFSASAGRVCWWATDVLNHRKRWCEKKKRTRERKNAFICSHSTDVIVGKWTQEMCMCDWDGVQCIQIHTNTHLALLLRVMNSRWVEHWKWDALLLTSSCLFPIIHFQCVHVCTSLCYTIHTKPFALLKRLNVSNPPQFGAC